MEERRGGISPPKIVSDRVPRTSAAPSPVPQVISRPVPPFPQESDQAGVRSRAAEASEMSLAADRTTYLVSENEFPRQNG